MILKSKESARGSVLIAAPMPQTEQITWPFDTAKSTNGAINDALFHAAIDALKRGQSICQMIPSYNAKIFRLGVEILF